MNGVCQICGRTWLPVEEHHCLSKNAGRHEVPEAKLTICRLCHALCHNGGITKDAQLSICLGRDRPELIEEIKQKVWDVRRERIKP